MNTAQTHALCASAPRSGGLDFSSFAQCVFSISISIAHSICSRRASASAGPIEPVCLPCPSLCVSFCLCVYLSLSVSLSLPLYVCLSASIYLWRETCIDICLYIYVNKNMYLYRRSIETFLWCSGTTPGTCADPQYWNHPPAAVALPAN